jgi:flagellar protein FlaG
MSSTNAIPAAPVDPVPVQPVQATTPAPAAPPVVPTDGGAVQAPALPIDDQPDLRLVIEEDKAAGSYVYKTVDPRTGQVISQIPREELLRMREADSYQPGSVIDSHS